MTEKRSHARTVTPSRRTTLVVVAVCAVMVGCRANSSARRGVQPVRLTDVSGYLEYVARDRNIEQRFKTSPDRKENTETIFEERFRIDVDGYVYHPNFLEFTLGGLAGLLQQENEEMINNRVRRFTEDGDIFEFDLNARFFKKKSFPGQIFAYRRRAIEPRRFRSSIESTTNTFGLNWQYIHPKMPTSLQLNDTAVDLNPFDPNEDKGSQQNSTFRFETAYVFNDHNNLTLTFDRRSIQQEPFKLDFDTDELTLAHRWDFGPDHRHRLDSELNIFDQTGSFEIKRRRWRESLRMQHSETLRSWYVAEALTRKQGTLSGVAPIDETSYSASATFEHQLYESLTTQLLAFYSTQDFKNGPRIDRFGGQASFDYRKKNPWGTLRASYRVRTQREERTGGELDFERVDERRTFRDPEPITLTGVNINTTSINITAEDRLTLYRATRDYRIERFPDRVEIRRVPTGEIADGETVLIDYVFTVGGSFDLDTLNHNVSIQQEFDFGLTPYYRLRLQNQDITPADATAAVAEDITAHIAGAEFKLDPLRLSAEYEDHDSNINPFRAVRLGAVYRKNFDFGASFDFRARWSDVAHRAPQRVTRFLTLEGRYRHPITRSLTVEGALIYRNQHDSLSRDDEGIDVDLTLEWNIRQTEIRVTYEFNQFDDDFTDSESSILFVQVRRNF